MSAKSAFKFRKDWHIAVSHDRELSAHARALAMLLWDEADWTHHTISQRSTSWLGEHAGFKDETVRKALDQLIARGHLDEIKGGRGRGRTNEFRMLRRRSEPTLFEAVERGQKTPTARGFSHDINPHDSGVSQNGKPPNEPDKTPAARGFYPPENPHAAGYPLSRESFSGSRAHHTTGNGHAIDATDWPPDTPLPDAWLIEAQATFAKAGMSSAGVDREAEKFLSHWRREGKRWRDWHAAWRNWVLKAIEFGERDRTRDAETIIDHTGRRVPKMGCA